MATVDGDGSTRMQQWRKLGEGQVDLTPLTKRGAALVGITTNSQQRQQHYQSGNLSHFVG
jgi:hypothetical protein